MQTFRLGHFAWNMLAFAKCPASASLQIGTMFSSLATATGCEDVD